MALLSSSPRTTIRDSNGPRAVDSGNTPSRHHRSRRHSKGDGGNGDKHRPKWKDSQQASCSPPSRREGQHGHRRKVSSPTSTTANPAASALRTESSPTLELTIIGQPAQGIALGLPITTSVVLSLRSSSSSSATLPSASQIDTSTLFALPTLLTETNQPLDPQLLTSTSGKPFASLLPLPSDAARTFERIHPGLNVLGYFSFSGLVIRQAGSFRIRTTLARMGSEGAVMVCATESEGVRVDRRASASTADRRRGHGVWG